MDKIIRNTRFNNLVNYKTDKSSADLYNNNYSSVDPNSLSSLIKNNQIIEYRLANISEKEIIEVTEPNIGYKK